MKPLEGHGPDGRTDSIRKILSSRHASRDKFQCIISKSANCRSLLGGRAHGIAPLLTLSGISSLEMSRGPAIFSCQNSKV